MVVGQILTLLGCEDFSRATHAGHSIQLFVRAPIEEEARMNVRYWVELNQSERDQLTTLLSGGKQAARKLKRAQRFCLRRMPALAMRRLPRASAWAALLCTGPSAASCSATWRRR